MFHETDIGRDISDVKICLEPIVGARPQVWRAAPTASSITVSNASGVGEPAPGLGRGPVEDTPLTAASMNFERSPFLRPRRARKLRTTKRFDVEVARDQGRSIGKRIIHRHAVPKYSRTPLRPVESGVSAPGQAQGRPRSGSPAPPPHHRHMVGSKCSRGSPCRKMDCGTRRWKPQIRTHAM